MLEGLYEECGLLATYLGTLLEGEVLFLTSIISAKMGLFNYYWALVAGFFGAYTKAWIKFILAKKQGGKLLLRKPELKAKLDKASVWFDKRPLFILSIYKLLYGMTTIIVLMAGLRNTSYLKFGIHAGIAIALWVIIVGSIGYFCADIMIDNIKLLSEKKWYVLGTLISIGLLKWYFNHRKNQNYYLKQIN